MDNNSYISEKTISKCERKRRGDKLSRGIFFALALLCASIIVVVIVFIVFKGLSPFIDAYKQGDNPSAKSDLGFFLTGNIFNGGYDADKGKYEYGAGFLLVNTLFLNLGVAVLAIPLSVFTSLFIVRIAPKFLSHLIQTGVDLLASIPSVIYGIFGLGVIVPLIRSACNGLGLSSYSGISMLAGIIVLSLMISPTIISVSVTSLKTVNDAQIKGSLALGASKTQTDFKICLTGAKSGIFAGIILGIGRSLGEATAVSMVCGSRLRGITFNPLESTVTLSSEILMEIGEAVPGSLNYDVRMSAGILLMLVILFFNLILNDVKKHYSSIDRPPLFIVKVFLVINNLMKKTFSHRKGKKQNGR